MGEWKVERWLSTEAVANIAYSEYWNDEAKEKGNFFDVLDGDFARMETYLDEVGLRQDLDRCLAELNGELAGSGIDLAAGTLWAAPRLIGERVDRLYCLELSEHRLLTYGPKVLEHYGIEADRVVLAHGSFYDLAIEDKALDFAFMSQALHHADDPVRLLREVHRVLRTDGTVIVIGEHRVRLADRVRYAGKALLSALAPRSRRVRSFKQPAHLSHLLKLRGVDLHQPDPMLGDHVYTGRDYREMFAAAGFSGRRIQRRGAPYHGFVLRAR